ncbi:MAG: urea ABC transporter permease subunit UrtC [Armatimonadota bacterium]|nr:urea ABC transporter permease subunit UrtC [Armatimonadota bacterium]
MGYAWGPVVLSAILLLVVAPLVLSDFQLNTLGKFLTYAILAVGLDLIWGYGGMLSLGQGLFFGLGGYAFAMYLKLEASGKHLPDFMDWSGATKLPLFWQPFHSPVFAIAMAIIVPMAVAGLMGYLVFRSRVQGVYFSIITQTLTLSASILFIGQQKITGGTNGITNLSTIFGHSLGDRKTQLALYLVTVICLGAVYFLCRWLTHSRFGRLLVAMRDDENRVRFLGYNPVALKTMVFALSGALAGLAGALFVPQVGIISPAAMAVVPSVEMVVWVAVGGRGTLIGAIIGAVLVNAGKSGFSDRFPDVWQYFLGALFIGSVLLFPMGVVGAFRNGVAKLRRGRSSEQPKGDVTLVLSPNGKMSG